MPGPACEAIFCASSVAGGVAGAVVDEHPFRALDDAGAGGVELAHV